MTNGDAHIPHLLVPRQQADATLSQNNPVSATLYTVLATTANVRIISMAAMTTGGTTSLLEIVVTIDGNTLIFIVGNPTTATDYYAVPVGGTASIATAQALQTTAAADWKGMRTFLLEGRSVQVQVRVTWTVQPSPLACRVKYAAW